MGRKKSNMHWSGNYLLHLDKGGGSFLPSPLSLCGAVGTAINIIIKAQFC